MTLFKERDWSMKMTSHTVTLVFSNYFQTRLRDESTKIKGLTIWTLDGSGSGITILLLDVLARE